MLENGITIIIPCYNASATIARAVISALREPEVREVIIVDDASTDDTVAQAISGADESKRLKIVALTQNSGPSAARNRAIAESTSPWIAILDADDFIMPGRFAPMLAAATEADFIADDLWQVPENKITRLEHSLFGHSVTATQSVSLAEFITSNVTRPGRDRGELGFIKPIMRRSFLDRHKIRYQEHMRLGEDYELYTRALAHGARLLLIPSRGYVSVMRVNSLSGQHTIEDLRALRDCDNELSLLPGIDEDARQALRAHYLSVDCRLQWRLLIEAVKRRNLKDCIATFQNPSPVPRYLITQLTKELFKRSGKSFRLPKPTLPDWSTIRAGITALIALALILLSQKQALRDLWQSWHTEEYSHGIAVIVIAALLALHRLRETKPVFKPSWLGPLTLLAGATMQIIAHFAAFDTIAEYGLIVELTGLGLTFLGRAATSAITPALIYLLFAVPLPHLVQSNLSQKLQLLSSTLGTMPLDALNIPVFQEGNIIDLGGYRLQVVEACNGLRYLFPLMSFGYLIALLFEGPFWKRATLFLSTIPISVGLNALRIALIGITVDRWGKQMAEGFLHGFEGWSVFVLCLLLLLLESLLLRPTRFRHDYLAFPAGPLKSGARKNTAPVAATMLLAAIMAFIVTTRQLEQVTEKHPYHAPLSSFPLSLGYWQGQEDSLAPEIINALHMSDYWIADYQSNAQRSAPVNLYIAYYETQRIGAMTHSPANCVPGGGWQIDGSETKTVTLPSGSEIKVTQLLIKRGNEAQLVNYWFLERGRDLTETTIAKWYLLIDSLTIHRTDGALIRLVTPITSGEELKTAQDRLTDFLNFAYPHIISFIPDGKTP